MSSNDSFYRKDNWLHDEKYVLKLKPYLSLFVELKKVHYDYVRAYILAKNVKPEDIDDIAFNVLVDLTVHVASKGEEAQQTKYYVLGIAHNYVIDYWNKTTRERKHIESTDEPKIERVYDHWESDNKATEKEQLRERRWQLLQECREEMLEKGKESLKVNVEMLLDKYFFDLNHKELAEMMGTTEGGIKSRAIPMRKLWEKCVNFKMQFNTYKPFM